MDAMPAQHKATLCASQQQGFLAILLSLCYYFIKADRVLVCDLLFYPMTNQL